MSNRYLNQLPYVALAVAALCAQQAHAATQTTAVQSVVSGPAGTGYVNFQVNPVASSAVANGTPIDLYFKGQLDGSLRCANIDGCGPISLALTATFNFNASGINGSLGNTNGILNFVSYGPTEYGDYLDLKSVKLASDPITLPYDWAKGIGYIADGSQSAPTPWGSLSIGYGSIYPDQNSWQQLQDYDHFTFGLIDPTFNIHYFAAAVPEPESYAMLAAGLASLTVVRRRMKNAR